VGIRVIRSILPPNLARLGHLEVNNWVLAFTFVVSLLAGLLSGSVYSFPSVRSDSKSPLLGIASDRGVGADVKPRRLQRTLAVCQLTLAVILVIAAGLLVRSLLGLLTVDFGFDSRNLLTVNVDPKSFARLSDAQEALFYRQVIDGVQSVPGVRNAAWTSSAPLGGAGLGTGFRLGSDFHAGSVQAAMQAFQEDLRDGRYADLQVVSSNYFQTVGIPLISGRPFSDRDNDAARPVISINRAMARRFWPNQDPIGNLVDVGEGGCICEIVGIVGDSRDSDLRTEARPKIYRPYPQGDGPLSVLLIRTAVNPLLMRNSIVGRIKRVNDTARITSIVTMDDVISRSVIDQKFQTTLLGFFATLATLLAVLGVYSVGSYAVTLRTREFGIRMALGANKKDVSRLVMRQAVNMTVTGVVLGLAGAFSLAHLMAKILYGVKPTDPLTFIGVAVLLSIVSLLASYLPACRASGTDIIAALRH
jgi:putative ABC transport system permease protein